MTRRVFYKATRMDGSSFFDNKTKWEVGTTVDVGAPARKERAACCSGSVLHASVVPHETLIGGSWPCRLFEVTGRPVAEGGSKRGFRKLTVVQEIESHLALGPQGVQLAYLIGQAERLSEQQVGDLRAARSAAWGAARSAAWGAARYAAWGAAGDAARDAAGALSVRDLIGQHGLTQEHYDLLTGPWARVVGPVHPEDAVVAE